MEAPKHKDGNPNKLFVSNSPLVSISHTIGASIYKEKESDVEYIRADLVKALVSKIEQNTMLFSTYSPPRKIRESVLSDLKELLK
jgi:hypothetical protein